jgi:hypothetical protein
MSPHPRPLLAIAVLLAPFLSATAFAQPPGGERGHRGPPPPAAFDACKDKKADDACQVTLPDHGDRTLKGTCAPTPSGRLACRPQPPPALFEACHGKQEGDSCSVQMGDHSFEGQCHQGRGDKLVCRPS